VALSNVRASSLGFRKMVLNVFILRELKNLNKT
jgi:hypothetical protein